MALNREASASLAIDCVAKLHCCIEEEQDNIVTTFQHLHSKDLRPATDDTETHSSLRQDEAKCVTLHWCRIFLSLSFC